MSASIPVAPGASPAYSAMAPPSPRVRSRRIRSRQTDRSSRDDGGRIVASVNSVTTVRAVRLARAIARVVLVDERGVGTELGIGVEAAVFGAIRRPARSRSLALSPGREDTLAGSAGEVVALNAIKIIVCRGGAWSGGRNNC